MTKKLMLSTLLSTLPFLLFGQANPVKNVEFSWISDGKGNLTCVESVSDAKLLKHSQVDKITRDLKVVPSTLRSAGGSGNLNIILRATTQLQENQEALNSFVLAAEAWENVVLNPVTVVIDVDYGPDRFGTAYSSANVIGSTSSAIYAATSLGSGTGDPVNFSEFGERLVSIHDGLATLYYEIPAVIPTETGVVSYPIATRPNLQALGYFPEVTSELTPFGQTPNIGFNSAFAFDFDQTNGIGSTLTDFQGVTVHEIGHALGFVSSIGYSNDFCTAWDIFRFRPGAIKELTDFAETNRVLTAGPLTSGGDQVYWDGLKEYELSTGASNGTGGDTRQASHWRDDALRTGFPSNERKIGVMDPTIGRGEIVRISRADLRLLTVIGWKIDHGNLISPPEKLTAFSDYKTPTSILLNWKNPEAFYDGRYLAGWKIVLQRNGTDVATFDNPTQGDLVQFTDEGITPGLQCNYKLFGVHTESGDTGLVSTVSWYAGGSLAPDAPVSIVAENNGSTSIFSVKVPSFHDDGTPLHNLNGYTLIRIRDKAEFKGPLSPSDTGKVIQLTDTAPLGASFPTTYSVAFTGAGTPDKTGPTLLSVVQRLGTAGTTLNETFDNATFKVVGTSEWKISKEDFMSTKAIGISGFTPGSFQAAYVAAIKVGKTQQVSFLTVARLNGLQANGNVELSSDNGKTWSVIKTLNSSSYPDWANGQNTWFKESVSLSAYEGKNVVIRFNLVSSGNEGSFGWFIDDILLETGTSVNGQEVAAVFSLEPNYPNPFNPSTKLSFSLPSQGKVTLKVMNILGQEIATLVDGIRPAGINEVVFDAKGLPSGVYFYRISAAGQTQTRKMILSK